jgi:hypothetical protein
MLTLIRQMASKFTLRMGFAPKMRLENGFRLTLHVLTLAALGFPSLAAGQASTTPDVAYEFHSVVPLGVETFKLEPSKQVINVLASAESHQFEGVRLIGHGSQRRVIAADGTRLKTYPSQVTFRVTASAVGKSLDERPVPIDTNTSLNDYLLSLRFRLKIFRGLDYRELQPVRAELIGVPADVAYDERIYRLLFNLNNVPVEERIMLEVYDSTGERLTRFHLELM